MVLVIIQRKKKSWNG